MSSSRRGGRRKRRERKRRGRKKTENVRRKKTERKTQKFKKKHRESHRATRGLALTDGLIGRVSKLKVDAMRRGGDLLDHCEGGISV